MAKCKLCGQEANFEFLTEKGRIWLCRKDYYLAERQEEKLRGLFQDYIELQENILGEK